MPAIAVLPRVVKLIFVLTCESLSSWVTFDRFVMLWHLLRLVCNVLAKQLLVLINTALAQAQSTMVCDVATKICFSSYTVPNVGITVGIALPMNVTDPYDAIISITAPVATSWGGFAWGGTMVFNPLTVGWANGQAAVVSSRFAL